MEGGIFVSAVVMTGYLLEFKKEIINDFVDVSGVRPGF